MNAPSERPSLQAIADSLAGYDPASLPVDQAQAFIARLVPTITGHEQLPLRSALGRVLAEPVLSPINVPSHDNSAMDGYALRGADLREDGPSTFEVVGKGLAGARFEGRVGSGQCIRITTGAVMPEGLDTVVPQEFTTMAQGRVHIEPGVVRTGDNRRLTGEDLARGSVALPAGRLVTPADLGVAASLGQAELQVKRRLRVAFFSTGDELRSLGQALDEGCLYDSNRYTIWGMLQRLGFVELMDMGVVRDNASSLEAAFREASACADAIVTSGGVSVGEADHTKQVMAALGDVVFWRIAMRPGRPMAIGRIQDGAILFGLPGNPVAVMVTFYAFVRPALMQMAGVQGLPLTMLRARCLTPMRKKPGRTEYQRGIVTCAADGVWQVRITGAQGSGILSSMSAANGLVVLPHESGNVAEGDEVDVWPFEGLA
ncbi:MAG: gephyrin-like molybdotransferase Glp [Burkholderiaceae bacterium]|jgi:molybdopterin molybdotransferase